MTIEKRHLARNNEEFNAQLVYRGRAFSVKVKNISGGGIFLKTDSLQIPQGTLVDLEFYYSGVEWQIAGLIVHKHCTGFGVMFKITLMNPGFQRGSVQPELIELPVMVRDAGK